MAPMSLDVLGVSAVRSGIQKKELEDDIPLRHASLRLDRVVRIGL
jgi:hypothetical protein